MIATQAAPVAEHRWLPGRWLQGRRLLLVAFAAGAAAHLAFVALVGMTAGIPGFIGPDTGAFSAPAFALKARPADLDAWFPERRSIGYPILLALSSRIFHDEIVPVILLQALAAGIAPVIAVLMVRRIDPSPIAAAAAAGAAALSPNSLAHAALLQTDSLHAIAVLGGTWLLVAAFSRKSRLLTACGTAAWMAAQAMRPTMHLAAVPFLLLARTLRKIFGGGPSPRAVTACAALLVLVPFVLFMANGTLRGLWTVSRTDETNAGLLAACVLSAAGQGDYRTILDQWDREDAAITDPPMVRLARLMRARAVLRAHPFLAARVVAVNAVKMLVAPADGFYALGRGRSRSSIAAGLLTVANIAGWVLVGAGFAAARKSGYGRAWNAALLAAGGMVLLISIPVPFQGARLRLPVDLLAAPHLGLGAAALAERAKRMRESTA